RSGAARAAPAPPLAPGERAAVDMLVRGPIPPGPYRLAFDMVAEARAWFSELGSATLDLDLDVAARNGEPHADLPNWVERGPGYDGDTPPAHHDGYAL